MTISSYYSSLAAAGLCCLGMAMSPKLTPKALHQTDRLRTWPVLMLPGMVTMMALVPSNAPRGFGGFCPAGKGTRTPLPEARGPPLT